MFDEFPARVWLLLLIGIFAWIPAQYVVRHVVHSPARRDITQPPEDLRWRTSGGLLHSALLLVGLAGAAIFIFTPYAERLAQGPQFFPILFALFAAWALYTVVRGFLSGRIEPLSRGFSAEYDRHAQPKRFWASLVWNAALGLVMLVAAYAMSQDASTEVAEDRCFGDDPAFPSWRMDHCPEVVAAYSAAIRDDPSDFAAHFNRAVANDRLGKRPEAIAGYSDAIRLRPRDADAYLYRGGLHLDVMDYDLALADFDRAHRLEPRHADALANRGLAHAWKGHTDQAMADFAATRAIDPTNLVVMRGEVLIAMNIADFGLAVTMANEALARHPDDPWLLVTRADANRRLSQDARARAAEMRVPT